MLKVPCSYQGGKSRIAREIVDIIYTYIKEDMFFYDLCCGSGAISIEMLNRGFNPNNIVMVDKSPWGLFWKQIGDGTFSMDLFKHWMDSIPEDITKIQEYMKELSKTSAHETQIDLTYIFLLLQASSFGSKSIWIKDNKWQNTSFRNYWLPTETSKRRSPVNPMMPMPNTLYERVQNLSINAEGIKGYWCDCTNIDIKPNSIIYIDPPYKSTTKYGFEFDYMDFIDKNKGNIIILSEGKPLSDISFNLTKERHKGGISGKRKIANEEWISIFNII